MPSNERSCRMVLTGAVPVGLLGKLMLVYCKTYPDAVALDAAHPVSRQHGATMVLVPKDDPVLEQKEQVEP